MRVTIRQGIAAGPTVASAPNFLQNNAGNINLVISTVPVTIVFAHGAANYVAVERATVNDAWGPLTGTNYLYWELNELTGALTRAATTLVPVTSASAPGSPATGQMWFDTTNTKMFEWSGSAWKEKVRVMAGTYDGSSVTAEALGSQVGLTGNFRAGYVMWDPTGFPIRVNRENGSWNFLTTDTELVTSASGSVVKLQNSSQYVRAGESMGAFSLVYTYADTLEENIEVFAGLASSNFADFETKAAIGIVTETLAANAIGQLVTGGIVANPNWAWTEANIGRSLYCGPAGEVTLTKPDFAKVRTIGTIISPTEIVLNFGWETDFDGVGPMGASGYSGYSGATGTGTSGYSGAAGNAGTSGYSGTAGSMGMSGYSGIDGAAGTSGYSGVEGTSGFSGYSGLDGAFASSGYSGINGASGFSGYSGVDGTVGASGYSGVDGTVGASGYSGVDGASGFSGYSGVGTSGFSGYSGIGVTRGTATLASGTVTVSTGAVTANSLIFITVQSLGTVTVPKAVAVTARTASTSFTITSEDVTDTSVVAWMFMEP